jgi:hypothetical protein
MPDDPTDTDLANWFTVALDDFREAREAAKGKELWSPERQRLEHAAAEFRRALTVLIKGER